MINFDYSLQPGKKLSQRPLVKDGSPLISIITAYYNGGTYFEQTYNCVLNQTFPWFEWIIVDDGSTNQYSIDLLNKLAATDSRIIVTRQDNSGSAIARNTGVSKAKADLIFIIDCDDLIEPTCLEYYYWALYYNPKAAWVFCDSVGFQRTCYLWAIRFNPFLMKTNNTLGNTALIRKKNFYQVDGYMDVVHSYHEDWELWLKLIDKGNFPVQIRKEYLYWYRRAETGKFYSRKHAKKLNIPSEKRLMRTTASFSVTQFPIIYPRPAESIDGQVRLSEWENCVFTKHQKLHVACLLPNLYFDDRTKGIFPLSEEPQPNLELSFLTLEPSENAGLQYIREQYPDTFNLPNFLRPIEYAEFISYFIISRQTDVLIITNTPRGYHLVPWLRAAFPELMIVDYFSANNQIKVTNDCLDLSNQLNDFLSATYTDSQNLFSSLLQMSESSTTQIKLTKNLFMEDFLKKEFELFYSSLKLEKTKSKKERVLKVSAEEYYTLYLKQACESLQKRQRLQFILTKICNSRRFLFAESIYRRCRMKLSHIRREGL